MDHIELMAGSTFTRGSFSSQHSRMERTHEMVDEILQ